VTDHDHRHHAVRGRGNHPRSQIGLALGPTPAPADPWQIEPLGDQGAILRGPAGQYCYLARRDDAEATCAFLNRRAALHRRQDAT
jgi:hypothetical protein